jgi:hypothetical protein
MDTTTDLIDVSSSSEEPDMLQKEYQAILNTIKKINSSAIEKESDEDCDEMAMGDGNNNSSSSRIIQQLKLKSPLRAQQIKKFEKSFSTHQSTPIKVVNNGRAQQENSIELYAIVFAIFSRLIGSGLRLSVSYLEALLRCVKTNIVDIYDIMKTGFAELETIDRNFNPKDAQSIAKF